MKILQKLILPILLILVVFIIYNIYFAKSGLGTFDSFDPNNTAVKEIRVQQGRSVEKDDVLIVLD